MLFQGDGIERLLVKGKKDQLEEVDGDPYKYFLLAGKKIWDPTTSKGLQEFDFPTRIRSFKNAILFDKSWSTSQELKTCYYLLKSDIPPPTQNKSFPEAT